MQEIIRLTYDRLVLFNKKTKYVTIIKCNLWNIIETYINIPLIIIIVYRFVKYLGLDYLNALDQILEYLARSLQRNITLKTKFKLHLIKYSNSDQAENHSNTKSISQILFIFNYRSINYYSKMQAVLILSSIIAEYVVLDLIV